MKLIVGLGNPEKKYEKTRHNIGFWLIDSYLKDVHWQTKFKGLFYKTIIAGEDIIFLKPLTYMNLSGKSVKEYVNYYNIDLNDILIIQDDLDQDFGKYKLKKNSSSGGHNGIKSIINELNSMDFARLKIGIKNNNLSDTIDFVLGNFTKEEQETLKKLYPTFEEIINSFINNGIERTMNIYNTK